jgi:carboxyl-terminal processing protease
MLVGDLITSIDGKPIDEMDRLDSISMLRGQPGTQVQVRINRQGEEVDITITRAVLK